MNPSDQCPVGRDVDAEALCVTDIEKVAKRRMKERLALHMQVDVARIGLDLVENHRETLWCQEGSRAPGRRAEVTRQIASIRDLQINLGKSFQSETPFE